MPGRHVTPRRDALRRVDLHAEVVVVLHQSTDDQVEEANPVKNVTIEVTPKQVEMVSLITQMGRLSLSLRSLQTDEGTVAETGGDSDINPVLARLINGEKPERGRGHTLDSEVSRLLESPKSKTNVRRVQVVRGSEAAVLEFQR